MAKKKKKKKGLSFNNITFHGNHCPIRSAGIVEIDYRDIEFLKLFLTEKGKIMPRRITGVSSSNQKVLTIAIKRARNLALLSFSEGYVNEIEEEANIPGVPFYNPEPIQEKQEIINETNS